MASEQETPAITIGRSDIRVLPLGVGAMTWGNPSFGHRFHPAQLAYGPTDGIEEERKAVDVSLAAGVNLFDTAAMYSYGDAERRLGDLTHDKKVVIATKFPSGFIRPKAEDLPGTLNASLEHLQRSTIDLYQVHYPFPSISIPSAMDLMAEAMQAKKIKAIGVSNFSEQQMRLAHEVLSRRGTPLASNQVQYSLLYRKPEVDGVLDACHELGITLIAYMPLAMGALTGKYTDKNRPRGLRRFMGQFRGRQLQAIAHVVELLNEIGRAHEKSSAQVALRWLIQQGNILPIPGARNGRQAAENAGALSFRISQSEVDAIDQATIGWRKE
jgi:aryl-alcohol dehydrogenase-like predicted oxidoreductase